MKRFFTTMAVLLALGAAIWIGAILFVGLLAVGAVGYGLYYLRGYLTEQGILNAQPGVPLEEQDQPERITIIEGDYTRVDENDRP